MTMELNATPGEVMRAVEALQAFARQHRASEKTIFALGLALEECASNIVNHALNRDARQKFQVTFDRADDRFIIELRDCGAEFDLTRATERKSGANDEDIPGGWGVQLVRRYMDDITYLRENGENVLRLTKRLEQAG